MRTFFRSLSLSLAAGGLCMTAVAATAGSPSNAIKAALAAPSRADQRDDDTRRKAAEVLAFAGVKRGDIVVDFLPGAGYWTRIFTSIVGPKGHVYAIWPASTAKFAAEPLPALQARQLANVSAEVQPGNLPTLPKPVDLFWTVQNYHDMANGGGETALSAFNLAVFKALKPGGIYIIIDHADEAGTGLSGTASRHRIDKAAVMKQVEAAGFRYLGSSDVLANPEDDHKAKIFDPVIKGHTDQFVLKFQKPA